MCEFCLKHGEGKKWYLQARNYSDDLANELGTRQMVSEFFQHPEAAGKFLDKTIEKTDRLQTMPKFVRDWFVYIITRRQKKVHYGQVLPIEDVEKIFHLTNSIVRIACYCRLNTVGKEKRYCYGVSLSPDNVLADVIAGIPNNFLVGPETGGVEKLTRDEALEAFRKHEREGLCHTVWTFQTPFIAGICNCDRSDCWAMRFTMSQAIPMMFRAEYVGQIDAEACNGCRECLRQCQFGALTWSASHKQAVLDQRWCYGCGICRAVCKQKAITLIDRAACPAAAHVW